MAGGEDGLTRATARVGREDSGGDNGQLSFKYVMALCSAREKCGAILRGVQYPLYVKNFLTLPVLSSISEV